SGYDVEVDVVGHGFALGVDLEDVAAPVHVGAVHDDLPVETARTQQCRVEDVGAVGGGDEDHTALDVEAVHLHQQLVEGLLPFVVDAAHAGSAVTAHCIGLVGEDDRGGVGLGLVEQVTHTGGADTDEHLDEVRTGDRVEGRPGLTRHRTGQQGLTG